MAEETYVIRTRSNDEKLVQEKRHLIARCAIELFAEKGFKATTMRELAQACGMAQGAVYHYIGTKDDILHLICATASSGGESMREYLKELGTANPVQALIACIRKYYGWADYDQENYIFFSREIIHFSRQDREMLLRSQLEIMGVFEELLNEANKKGKLKVDNPAFVAHQILITGYDWALRRWYLRSHFTLEEYCDWEIRMLLRQLGVDARVIPKLIEKSRNVSGA